jgi:2-haloacid dehalogenase
MTAIRHIVLDLGNVLIRWDPEGPFRRLIPDAETRRFFMENVCSPEWNMELDRGRTWEEGEAIAIAEYPEHEAMIRAFQTHWLEMLPSEVDGSVAILETLLARGHDVTALTNWSAETWPTAQPRFPFLQRFRGVTVSGQVKLVKPEPAIYRLHAESFGLDPAATLFFDDNPGNVAGARAVGWQAEVFTDAATMRADLRRHGVAID